MNYGKLGSDKKALKNVAVIINVLTTDCGQKNTKTLEIRGIVLSIGFVSSFDLNTSCVPLAIDV